MSGDFPLLADEHHLNDRRMSVSVIELLCERLHICMCAPEWRGDSSEQRGKKKTIKCLWSIDHNHMIINSL